MNIFMCQYQSAEQSHYIVEVADKSYGNVAKLEERL